MKKPSHIALKLAVLALCALVLVLWVSLSLPCPIRHLTGLPCPGCGMSRAWLAALRLDFAQAFRCHPMFWAVPVVALFAVFDFRLLPKPRHNALALILIGAGVAVCYFVRLAAFLER